MKGTSPSSHGGRVGEKMFQAEGTAEAQTVRQDRYWRVQGAALRTLAYGMERRG